jgi:hypothetical protein
MKQNSMSIVYIPVVFPNSWYCQFLSSMLKCLRFKEVRFGCSMSGSTWTSRSVYNDTVVMRPIVVFRSLCSPSLRSARSYTSLSRLSNACQNHYAMTLLRSGRRLSNPNFPAAMCLCGSFMKRGLKYSIHIWHVSLNIQIIWDLSSAILITRNYIHEDCIYQLYELPSGNDGHAY